MCAQDLSQSAACCSITTAPPALPLWEFAQYESAKIALDCSGALMGTMPIRVTPSKAPVRDEA